VPPLDDAFTAEYVQGLFAEVPPDDPRVIKGFVISKPGIWGVGNGYLPDILFRARLHPRRRVTSMGAREQRALHRAAKTTITQAVKANGRDTERDLHNQPGRYVRILDSRAVGKPCPECGAPIEKIALLGGAAYFCPRCQT
jgi:formamidopyrimidine-DNA glycosylase